MGLLLVVGLIALVLFRHQVLPGTYHLLLCVLSGVAFLDGMTLVCIAGVLLLLFSLNQHRNG